MQRLIVKLALGKFYPTTDSWKVVVEMRKFNETRITILWSFMHALATWMMITLPSAPIFRSWLTLKFRLNFSRDFWNYQCSHFMSINSSGIRDFLIPISPTPWSWKVPGYFLDCFQKLQECSEKRKISYREFQEFREKLRKISKVPNFGTSSGKWEHWDFPNAAYLPKIKHELMLIGGSRA